MSNWFILRTDARKEAYVAQQIRNAGFESWHPVQVIACRPAIARRITAKTQLKAYREIAILPRRLFVQADVLYGGALVDALQIRHCLGFERDGYSATINIPDAQIAAFRAVIDAENRAALALSQSASRRQKQKWRSLHDALVEMIDAAKTELEQAA